MYAQHFHEIPQAVEQNSELQDRILELVDDEPITGKAVQGHNRTAEFRQVLQDFFNGSTSLEETYNQVSSRLPKSESPHSRNNNVFPDNWDERLARTQISRFYNQAVLQQLTEEGEQQCFVPHSPDEDRDTDCTRKLAGETVDVSLLQDRLQRAYQDGEYHDQPMIPDHPHCTHVVTPPSDT